MTTWEKYKQNHDMNSTNNVEALYRKAEENSARKRYQQYLSEVDQADRVLAGTGTPKELEAYQNSIMTLSPQVRSAVHDYGQKYMNNNDKPLEEAILPGDADYDVASDHVRYTDTQDSIQAAKDKEALTKALGKDNVDRILEGAKASARYYADAKAGKGGGYLSPDQQIAKSTYELGSASKDLQNDLNELGKMKNAQAKTIDSMGGADVTGSVIGNKANLYKDNSNSKSIKAKEEEIKKKYNLSDEQLKKYIDYEDYLATAQYQQNDAANYYIGSDWNGGMKALASVRNSAAALKEVPMKAIGGVASHLTDRDKTLGYNINNYYMTPINRAEAAQSQVANNAIGDDTGYQKVGQFAYNTGMSTAEAAINIGMGAVTGLGQAYTLGQFAGSSYASTYKKAKMNGYSDKNANALGIASAAIETGTELVSLDHLYSIYQGNKKIAVKALTDLAIQAGIEGSEEAASDILNRMAQYMHTDYTGLSDMDRSIADYKSQGLSDSDARAQAEKDFWIGVAEDFVSGAISGGLMSAPQLAGAINYTAKENRANRAEMSDIYANEAADNTGTSREDVIAREQALKYAENPVRAQVDMIDDSTESGKARKAEAMKYVDKYEKNGKLSKIDEYDLNNLINDDMSAQEKFQKYTEEITDATSGINEDEFRSGMVEAIKNGDAEAISKVVEEAKNSTSTELRNSVEQIANEYKGMAETKGISAEQFEAAMVDTKTAYEAGLNNQQIDNLFGASLEAHNKGNQTRIENHANEIKAKSETITTELAKKTFIENADNNISADTYEEAFNVLYKGGASGATFENTIKGGKSYSPIALLGQDTSKLIYNVGLADRKAEVSKRINSYVTASLGIKKGSGTFKNISNTAKDIDSMMLSALAKKLGQDIVLEDKLSNGDNGIFVASSGEIHLTPNKLFSTTIHEGLGEFTKYWASDEYNKIAEAATNAFISITSNDTYQNILDETHAKYLESNKNQTIKESSNEVANDIFAAIVETEKGRNELFRWLTEKNGVEEARRIGMKISQWFKKLVNSLKSMIAGSKMTKVEAALVNKKCDELEKLSKDLLDAVDVAIANYQAFQFEDIKQAIGEDFTVETDKNGNVVLFVSEDNSNILINHSRATMEYIEDGEVKGTNKKLYDIMIKNGYTTFEANQAVETVAAQARMLSTISKDYIEMANALDAMPEMMLVTDVKNRRQVYRSFVNNGEYPINVDFLTICKKRQAYMQVLNDLVDEGIFDKVVFDAKAIAATNTILRDKGFETACLGCFVESRRLQIQTWAETFVKEWNEAVLSKNPNATPFPFSVGAGEVGNISAEDIMKIENAFKEAPKNKSGGLDLKGKSATTKMRPLIDIAEELGHTLVPGDLVKPSVLTKIRQTEGGQMLFSLIRSRYGSNTPKIAQEFNPYNSEVADLTPAYMANEIGNGVTGLDNYSKAIAKDVRKVIKGDTEAISKYPPEVQKRINQYIDKLKNHEEGYSISIRNENFKQLSLAAYIYDVGGIRLQSFSDFLIENVMDYFQLIADAQAQNLPIHAYSKEIIFARIFGMTGMKINMSLIPEVIRELGKENAGLKADDSYAGWGDFEHHIMMNGQSFIQSIGYKDAIALQLDPRYERNVGTIAIGISNKHIEKMLNDPLIRMVIPYHSSGMNPEFAEKIGIDVYNDYTLVQNTRVKESLNGYDYEYIGKGTSKVKLLNCTYEFNGETITSTGEFSFNHALQKHNGDAKMAAKEYLAWCAAEHNMEYTSDELDERGKKKKIRDRVTLNPKFDEFASHDNYYKLLEDFNTYDYSDNAARQSSIKMEYPNGLSAEQEAIYRQRLVDSKVFNDKEIEKYVDIAKMSLEELIKKEANARNDYRRKQDKVYDETKSEIIDKLMENQKPVIKESKDVDTKTDSDYMKAVESGDMKTAQKMVDEAAKKAGYKVKAYHGSTAGKFNIFRTEEIDNNMGSHFGSLETAKGFAEGEWAHSSSKGTVYSVYLKADNPYETYDWFAQDDYYPAMEAAQLADQIGTPEALALKEEIKNLDPAFGEIFEEYDLIEEGYLDDEKSEILYGNFRKLLELGGYDSILYENGLEMIGEMDWIIQHPEQIKLADPVTYDDNGNVIPLSERFNLKSPDIRYSKEIMTDEEFMDSLLDDGFFDELLADKEIKILDDWKDVKVNAILDDLRKKIEDAPPKQRKAIEHHLTRKALGDAFQVKGKTVAFKDERIDKYLRMFGSSTDNYAQAYITYMSPSDYMLMTANGNKGSSTFDRLVSESHEFDEEEFTKAIDSQPIFLDINEDNKISRVIGHEGRHRMIALQLAGYTEIPVLLFDFDNKYSKSYIPSMRLKPQDFTGNSNYNKSNEITLYDIEPLSNGNADNIKAKFGSGKKADIRFSKNVDSDGTPLSENKQKFFAKSQMRNDEGQLMPMYHGARGAGFTIFDPEYSDDRASLFFTDNINVAKTYAGTDELFEPDKPMTYDELEDIMSSDGGDLYLERDGDQILVREYGFIGEEAEIVYSGDLKGAQEYFMSSLGDLSSETSSIYKVYLNVENPYIVDAKGANWDELPVDKWKEHYGDVQITDNRDGQYTVEYQDSNHEWHNVVLTWDQIEKTFGIDYKVFENGEMFFQDIYLDENGELIPTNTRQLSSYARKHGHDGVIIKNVYDIGLYASRSEEVASTVAIVFDGTNVKSVYNENPTKSVDYRFSKDIDDVLFDIMNESIPSVNESILDQGLAALKGKTVDTRAINKIASEIKNEYGSNIDSKTLSDMLSRAFAYLHNQNGIKFNDVLSLFEEVAKPVIDNATKLDNKELYDGFVEYFKDKKIKLTESQMADVRSQYGSYPAFQKAVYPLQFSVNGETSLDTVWSELMDMYPGLIEYENEADQPAALDDVLKSLKPKPQNVFGADVEEVGKDLAMQIVQKYFDMQTDAKLKRAAENLKESEKQYRADVRKKYQEKLNEVKKELAYNQRWKDAERNQKLNEKVDDYNKKVADIKAKSKDRMTNYKDRVKAREQQKQIEKVVRDLIGRVTNPTEQKHVPSKLADPLAQFLQCLDFVEPEVRYDKKTNEYYIIDYTEKLDDSYGRITGKSTTEVLQKFYDKLNRGQGTNKQLKWQNSMSELQRLFNKSANLEEDLGDVINLLDATMGDQLEDLLERNKNTINVRNLSTEDLIILKNALKNIAHAINVQNKAFTMKAEIPTIAHGIQNQAEKINAKDHTKFRNQLHDMLVMNMMTPETYFTLLGAEGRGMYTAFERALEKKIGYVRDTENFMDNLLGDTKPSEIRKWRDDIKTISTSEGDIKMSVAHIMSLYELSKRNQALLHMPGGIEVEKISSGLMEINQNRGKHLSPSELSKLFATLTDEQIRIADGMQQYMANVCGGWGNEASLLMYDFEKFLDPRYYPIVTDSNTNQSTNNENNMQLLNGLERIGFTKAVNKNASNPIIIKDIFSVFTEHATNMAAYASFAPVIKDALRVYNYKDVVNDGDNKNYIPVKRALSECMGRTDNSGKQYFDKLIRDINGNERADRMKSFGEQFVGAYKAAAVGANARVVVQQPTAYIRAAALIKPQYLLEATPKAFVHDMKKLREENALIYWKSKGYYETSMGKNMESIVLGTDSVKDKLVEASMWLAGAADDMTWACLYNACERQIKAENKGLSDDEYKAKVNELFSEVIHQTQVVDSTLMKSPWQRSKDGKDNLMNAFMAEPIKSYNMALKATIQAERGEISKGKLLKVLTVLTATDAVNALAQAFIDAIRHRDDDEDYMTQVLNYWLDNFKDNINPLKRIPFIKDIVDQIPSALSGESSYGQTSGQLYEYAAMNTLLNAITSWAKKINGDYNKTNYALYMDTVKALSQLSGMPVYNFSRDAVATWNMFSDHKLVTKVEKANDKYKNFTNVLDMEKSDEDLKEAVKKMFEDDGTVKGAGAQIKSTFRSDYLDAIDNGDKEVEEDIYNKAVRGYMSIGMNRVDAEKAVESWSDKEIGYSDLDKAIESGDGIELAAKVIKSAKDEDKILKHIYDYYGSTIENNRANGYVSDIENNVNEVLKYIDGSSYDKLARDQEKAAAEKAEAAAVKEVKSEKNNAMYSVVESGGDFRSVVSDAYNSGISTTDIKKTLSTKYKDTVIQMYKDRDPNYSKYLTRIAKLKAEADKINPPKNIAKTDKETNMKYPYVNYDGTIDYEEYEKYHMQEEWGLK